MTTSLRNATGLALAMLMSGTASAANLLDNPGFVLSGAGWTLFGADDAAFIFWHDYAGRDALGTITLTVTTAATRAELSQCVTIPTQAVDAYAHIKANVRGENVNYGQFSIAPYASPDCSGPALAAPTTSAPEVSRLSPWVLHRIDNTTLAAGTQSVLVKVAMASSDSETHSIFVDDVGFGPAGTLGLPPPNPNRVQNGDFHHDLYRWTRTTEPFGSAYRTEDTGMPDIGAALLIGVDDSSVNVSQCVVLPVGVLDIYALSDSALHDDSQVDLTFHADRDCATAALVSERATEFRWPGEWTLHHLLDYTPPAGSVAARMTLSATANGLTAFDHAVLGVAGTVDRPATTYTVFANGFE